MPTSSRPTPRIADPTTSTERAATPDGWSFDLDHIAAFDTVVRSRRDVRKFRPTPLPERTLEAILAAGHAAPSVGHSQPWRFVIVSNQTTRDKAAWLADQARLRQAAQMTPESARGLLDLQLEGIREAPVGVVVCCDRRAPAAGVLGRHTFTDADMWSCACAIQNMWLAARARGVGMGWVTLFDPADLADLVGAPDGVETLGWLCFGYPDERPPTPGLERAGWSRRQPLATVISHEVFDQSVLPPPHHRGPAPTGDAAAMPKSTARQQVVTQSGDNTAHTCGTSRHLGEDTMPHDPHSPYRPAGYEVTPTQLSQRTGHANRWDAETGGLRAVPGPAQLVPDDDTTALPVVAAASKDPANTTAASHDRWGRGRRPASRISGHAVDYPAAATQAETMRPTSDHQGRSFGPAQDAPVDADDAAATAQWRQSHHPQETAPTHTNWPPPPVGAGLDLLGGQAQEAPDPATNHHQFTAGFSADKLTEPPAEAPHLHNPSAPGVLPGNSAEFRPPPVVSEPSTTAQKSIDGSDVDGGVSAEPTRSWPAPGPSDSTAPQDASAQAWAPPSVGMYPPAPVRRRMNPRHASARSSLSCTEPGSSPADVCPPAEDRHRHSSGQSPQETFADGSQGSGEHPPPAHPPTAVPPAVSAAIRQQVMQSTADTAVETETVLSADQSSPAPSGPGLHHELPLPQAPAQLSTPAPSGQLEVREPGNAAGQALLPDIPEPVEQPRQRYRPAALRPQDRDAADASADTVDLPSRADLLLTAPDLVLDQRPQQASRNTGDQRPAETATDTQTAAQRQHSGSPVAPPHQDPTPSTTSHRSHNTTNNDTPHAAGSRLPSASGSESYDGLETGPSAGTNPASSSGLGQGNYRRRPVPPLAANRAHPKPVTAPPPQQSEVVNQPRPVSDVGSVHAASTNNRPAKARATPDASSAKAAPVTEATPNTLSDGNAVAGDSAESPAASPASEPTWENAQRSSSPASDTTGDIPEPASPEPTSPASSTKPPTLDAEDKATAPSPADVVAARDQAAAMPMPAGSLGFLDRAIDKVVAALGAPLTELPAAHVVVAAGDHLVADLGVTAFERSLTAQVVAAGKQGVSCGAQAAKAAGLDFHMVDCGTSAGDLATSNALTRGQFEDLVDAGSQWGRKHGGQIVALGEVGMGNTTVGAAMAAALLRVAPGRVVGLGADADADMLRRKEEVVTAAVQRLPQDAEPAEIVMAVGGPEVAYLVGVTMSVAAAGGVIVTDGLVSSVAVLAACRHNPAIVHRVIAGQRSRERGHSLVLAELGLEPLLDLRLRSGEGIGSTMATQLLRTALHVRLSSESPDASPTEAATS